MLVLFSTGDFSSNLFAISLDFENPLNLVPIFRSLISLFVGMFEVYSDSLSFAGFLKNIRSKLFLLPIFSFFPWNCDTLIEWYELKLEDRGDTINFLSEVAGEATPCLIFLSFIMNIGI